MGIGLTITLEATRLKCDNCGFLYVEDDPDRTRSRLDPAYRCGKCNHVFGAEEAEDGKNQCPECGTFAAKVDPDEYAVCTECGEASSFEEVYVITCVCHDEEHEVYC